MMLDERDIRLAYFLGIGGIGMSALARYFLRQGVSVHGYDKTSSILTDELITEGMHIHFEDAPDRIPADTDIAIFTPAIPTDLGELLRIHDMGVPLLKRAEALGIISKSYHTIAVAGTHGKTTITSMIAHIMAKAGRPLTAMLGGISKNYDTNYVSQGKGGSLVVEADEFDRSFLQLTPDIAVISSMDADHLDIYESRESMLHSFSQFASQVKPAGQIIIKAGLEKELPEIPGATYYTVSNWADFSIKDLRIEQGKHTFSILGKGKVYPNILLPVPGRHNVENALAAVAVCSYCNISTGDIVAGLNTYLGVRRRFDIRVEEGGRIFIDDYAHHPAELEAFIRAVREVYPDQKITGIFQPHLYSRTKDFAEGFASSMDKLDEPILLDIYPAREKPIPEVSSGMILDMMKNRRKKLMDKDSVLKLLEKRRPELVVTIGAGDIDLLVPPIEKMMRSWI